MKYIIHENSIHGECLLQLYCTQRRSVIDVNEAVAYPVFGHAVEL